MRIEPKPAIYKIENTTTKDFYIGATKNIRNRWRGHIYDLRKNKHRNPRLQQAFEDSGRNLDVFELSILEYLDDALSDDSIVRREQEWIDFLKPTYNSRNAIPKYGSEYYIDRERKLSGKSNRIMPEEERARRGKAVSEWWKTHTLFFSEERRQALSERMSGDKHPLWGKPVSEDRRKAIADGVSKVEYTLVSPNGEDVIFRNMRQFCREKELSSTRMYLLTRGLIDHHKGWKFKSKEVVGDAPKRKRKSKGEKQYKTLVGFISPDGVEFGGLENLMKFCSERQLNYDCMMKLDNGKLKSYKGWTKIP